MPKRNLQADYEESWDLLLYILMTAIEEPHLAQSRRHFTVQFEPSPIFAVRTIASRQRSAKSISIEKAVRDLTPLDAFALWSSDDDFLSRADDVNRAITVGPLCNRFLGWLRDWSECRTDAQKGKQALITFLILRDRPSVRARLVRYLDDLAAKSHEPVDAFALRVGSILLQRDPSPRELRDLEWQLLGSRS